MTYEQIIRMVSPYAPQAPSQQILDAILAGARQFCDETSQWEVELHRQEVTSDDEEVYPVPPSDSRLVRLTTVKVNDVPVPHEWDGEEEALRLLAPRSSGTLVVKGAVEPTDDATTVPGQLERWVEAIADYAIYRVLSVPRTDYYDANVARERYTNYRDAVNQAKATRNRAGTSQPLRVAPVRII